MDNNISRATDEKSTCSHSQFLLSPYTENAYIYIYLNYVSDLPQSWKLSKVVEFLSFRTIVCRELQITRLFSFATRNFHLGHKIIAIVVIQNPFAGNKSNPVFIISLETFNRYILFYIVRMFFLFADVFILSSFYHRVVIY